MTTAQIALSFSLCVVLILAATGSHAAHPAKFNVVSYTKPKGYTVSTHVAINVPKNGEVRVQGYLEDYSNDTTTCYDQEYYWNCTYDDRPLWLNTSWVANILVLDSVCNVLVGFQPDRTVVEFIPVAGLGTFNFSSTSTHHKFTGASCVTKDHVSYCRFDPSPGWAWAAVTGDTHGLQSVNWQCGL